jgi:hypothetical protein
MTSNVASLPKLFMPKLPNIATLIGAAGSVGPAFRREGIIDAAR